MCSAAAARCHAAVVVTACRARFSPDKARPPPTSPAVDISPRVQMSAAREVPLADTSRHVCDAENTLYSTCARCRRDDDTLPRFTPRRRAEKRSIVAVAQHCRHFLRLTPTLSFPPCRLPPIHAHTWRARASFAPLQCPLACPPSAATAAIKRCSLIIHRPSTQERILERKYDSLSPKRLPFALPVLPA